MGEVCGWWWSLGEVLGASGHIWGRFGGFGIWGGVGRELGGFGGEPRGVGVFGGVGRILGSFWGPLGDYWGGLGRHGGRWGPGGNTRGTWGCWGGRGGVQRVSRGVGGCPGCAPWVLGGILGVREVLGRGPAVTAGGTRESQGTRRAPQGPQGHPGVSLEGAGGTPEVLYGCWGEHPGDPPPLFFKVSGTT